MPDLSCRRGFLYLLGIMCLFVLLIYAYQQELRNRTLPIENIFPGASQNNVSAHSTDDFSKAVIRRLSEATDEDASKKKKDDIEESQVMCVGSKLSFIQVSQLAHFLYWPSFGGILHWYGA
jgi:hypothetical protein